MFTNLLRSRASSRKSHKPARRSKYKPFAEVLEDRWLLAQLYWTGIGDGEKWSDPKNWYGKVAPMPEDEL